MIELQPIFQRKSFDCGRAVVQTVLTYYGRDPKETRRRLQVSSFDGVHPAGIAAFLRDQGLKVLLGEMTLGDLRWQTRQGRPVIALVQRAESGHYLVVKGVRRGRVFYADPADGAGDEHELAFLGRWHDTDGLGTKYEYFGLSVFE